VTLLDHPGTSSIDNEIEESHLPRDDDLCVPKNPPTWWSLFVSPVTLLRWHRQLVGGVDPP
jgi:hypothetical protein